MQNLKKTTSALLLVCASLALTGCWESADVTIYEPGVYQGAVDNLKSDSNALQTRFQNQFDR